ncbi:hypothetical protein BZM27_49360 [Paraburkholderia steynii]|uniref:Uncharacterized protein n=1 Tax=Paraburkholderia steynii TaxID=1245441 RepID=A0A4R0X3P0_9BURK|nr:hypothetical protein BZM27_49360 [Paraburkholderia steynii]
MTGILATMPYIALRLVGIRVTLSTLGFPTHGWLGELPLFVAFGVLTIYTWSSGLRAPAMIAVVLMETKCDFADRNGLISGARAPTFSVRASYLAEIRFPTSQDQNGTIVTRKFDSDVLLRPSGSGGAYEDRQQEHRLRHRDVSRFL